MLHDEVNGIAALAAAKAFEDALGGGYGEGRCFLVMEGAETDIVDPPFPERDEFLHDIFDVCSVKYLFYSVMRDHVLPVVL